MKEDGAQRIKKEINCKSRRHTDKTLGNRIGDTAIKTPQLSILDEARIIVNGERSRAYGSPAKSFQHIADLWSTILETDISINQVGLCMIAMKLSRETGNHKRDNLVDIAGYAEALNQALKGG